MLDLRVLIAVRPPEEGKSRLATVLSADQRNRLNRRLFEHVCGVSLSFLPANRIIIVTRSPDLLAEARERGMHAVAESGSSLNEALEQGAVFAASLEEGPLLTLATDLPALRGEDLAAIADALREADVAIAPDHNGCGTNALLMRRPAAIPFRYGANSLQAHIAECGEAGLRYVLIERPGFALDIDTPGDLSRLPWLDIAGD
jgi:2-phospho-L-lactate guanylyltransferase